MCGIAGHVTTGPSADGVALHHQLAVLEHRGPDSCGYFKSTHAAIGTTRLAVIDISGGTPPLVNESAHVVAALNGEIYNYRELRATLTTSGHHFRTRTDTEVLVHLSEDLDPLELATRLEGMFACAIWDDRTQRLILIRDRAGKKPLYYWHDESILVFGSEVKAVLAHPGVPRRIDPGMIADYLALGYVPSPNTSFEGIFSLPPAHLLVLDQGFSMAVKRYWSPPASKRSRAKDPIQTTRALLTRAVKRRLDSDVPLGAFLSGGLDSSTVVAIASPLVEGKLQTFTIGFDDTDGFDERRWARHVAQRFQTQHHEIVVKPDAVDLIERLVWHYDGPFGDSSAIPTFLLSEATRGAVTVALTGDGGDEIFSGYTRFTAAHYSAPLLRLPPMLRALIRQTAKVIPAATDLGRHSRRFLASFEMGLPRSFMEWISYSRPEERRALLHGDLNALAAQVARYEHAWRTTASEKGTLARLLRLNFSTYLPDDLLMKVDRMSMAHGLEVRSPLLDRELVEWAFSVPARAHIHKGRGKYLLRRAMSEVLPAEILGRKKKGFGVPLDRWFREDLRTYLQHHLGSSNAQIKTFLNPSAVDDVVHSHLANRADRGHLLWALLTLEVFLRSEA